MNLDLAALGITPEELANRVVKKLADEAIADREYDAYLETALTRMVKSKIDAAVEKLGDKTVGPKVEAMIESFTLQATNSWGERTGESLTFTEYLVKRAEAYIVEPVDHKGQAKGQSGYGSWTKNGTRIAYMIDEYLQYHIKRALETALADLNSKLSQGIADTVKTQLTEVIGRVKTTITTK